MVFLACVFAAILCIIAYDIKIIRALNNGEVNPAGLVQIDPVTNNVTTEADEMTQKQMNKIYS